ncbi:MAG TPA: hypothetical protein VKI44_32485 [Acetobacteraceae bacterium]|nr:hypothetical protein [Acetobacteraceae bacterium]
MNRTVERNQTRSWLATGVRIACAIGITAVLSGCVAYPYRPAYYHPYYTPY